MTSQTIQTTETPTAALPAFPFTAVCGQQEFREALLWCAVDHRIGGVLALGDRGTGKTTTVRGLADLFGVAGLAVPVVTLPLGATEDRVIGSLDLESALVHGERRFAPGLLAAADRGFLYVDEINLLDDFLVDVLLDVAASGVNLVERDGVSHRHPARFVLVGSGNPEEGELRPQLEDRFGLSVRVGTITDPQLRSQIIDRRLAFSDDPHGFVDRWSAEQHELGARLLTARERLDRVSVPAPLLDRVVQICVASGAVGHRAELVMTSASRAAAALAGALAVTEEHLRACAPAVLRHRVPREAFDAPETIDQRIAETLDRLL